MPITKLRPTFTFDQDRFNALKPIAPAVVADSKINWEPVKGALSDHLEEEGRGCRAIPVCPGRASARRGGCRAHAYEMRPRFLRLPVPKMCTKASGGVERRFRQYFDDFGSEDEQGERMISGLPA